MQGGGGLLLIGKLKAVGSNPTAFLHLQDIYFEFTFFSFQILFEFNLYISAINCYS